MAEAKTELGRAVEGHEKALVSLGIRRILVDASAVSRILAKRYFFGYNTIRVDYASYPDEATEMIRDAYRKGSGYDVVIAEIRENDHGRGFAVIREAEKHYAFSSPVTEHAAFSFLPPHMGQMIDWMQTSHILDVVKELKISNNYEPDERVGKLIADDARLLPVQPNDT